MSKQTDRQYEEFARMLLEGYKNWFNDQVTQGTQPFQVKESKWCELFHYKQATWSKWRNGNTLPDDDNLAKLATNPYIGPGVLATLPSRAFESNEEEQEFQEFMDDFYSLDRDTQRAILKIWRKHKVAHTQQVEAAGG